MLIKRILISNYKTIEKAELDLDPGITILYGPNSAGKSSILDAITLITRCTYGVGKIETGIEGIAKLINKYALKNKKKASIRIESHINILGEVRKIGLEIGVHKELEEVPVFWNFTFEDDKGAEILHVYDYKEGAYTIVEKARRIIKAKHPLLEDRSLLDSHYYEDLEVEKECNNLYKTARKLDELFRTEKEVYIGEDKRKFLSNILTRIKSFVSREKILEEIHELLIESLQYGRTLLEDFIRSMNHIVSDVFIIEDIKYIGETRWKISSIIEGSEKSIELPLIQLSDGMLRLMYILLKILSIDYYASNRLGDILEGLGKKESLSPMILIEGLDCNVHVDWLINFLDWFKYRRPKVQLCIETHSGLMLSGALKYGYRAYYIKEGKAYRVDKERLSDVDLFEREVKVRRDLLS